MATVTASTSSPSSGLNADAAAQLSRRLAEDLATDMARRLKADTAEARRGEVRTLAIRYGQWALAQGWPPDYKSGLRKRGWYVVNTTTLDDRHSHQNLLVISTDGHLLFNCNVEPHQVRQAIVDKINATGAPWPFDD